MILKKCPICKETFTVEAKHAEQIHCSQVCAIEARHPHRLIHTKIYESWANMKRRCNDSKSNNFHRYGGRGITYDPKWENFEGFYEDMNASYKEGLTIERKDNDKNYCKDNCIWATPTQQARNRKSNVYVNTSKDRMLLIEVAELYKIPYPRVHQWYKAGKLEENLKFLDSIKPVRLKRIHHEST